MYDVDLVISHVSSTSYIMIIRNSVMSVLISHVSSTLSEIQSSSIGRGEP